MNVSLTGNGLELTDALREYTKEKLSKLSRHNEQMTAIHVVLSTENKRQKAEAQLNIPHGKDLHASAVTDDLYLSIDQLGSKLERMLRKQKEKTIDASRKGIDKDLFIDEVDEEV